MCQVLLLGFIKMKWLHYGSCVKVFTDQNLGMLWQITFFGSFLTALLYFWEKQIEIKEMDQCIFGLLFMETLKENQNASESPNSRRKSLANAIKVNRFILHGFLLFVALNQKLIKTL